MLKRVDKEHVSCPILFYEETIAVFKLNEISQIGTETDKKLRISTFQRFYAVFVKFMTVFVDWNVRKGQQGKNLLSSRLFWMVN